MIAQKKKHPVGVLFSLFHRQHDLADALAPVKQVLCFLGFLDGKHRVDGGLYLARLDLRIDLAHDAPKDLCI